jgi:hypothetical protein
MVKTMTIGIMEVWRERRHHGSVASTGVHGQVTVFKNNIRQPMAVPEVSPMTDDGAPMTR